MRAFSSSLLSWLAAIGCAAAQEAYIYNIDIQPRSASASNLPPIDSETANAILARRLGATESIRLGPVDDLVLEHLNQYGGQQALSPFEDEATSATFDRLIFAIDGYDGEPLPASPGLRIERADTNLASIPYMKDVIEQGGHQTSTCSRDFLVENGSRFTHVVDTRGGPCLEKEDVIKMFGGKSVETGEEVQDSVADATSTNTRSGMRGFLKMDISRKKGMSAEQRNSAIEEAFKGIYQNLEALARSGEIESTILLLPSQRAPPTLNLNRRQTPQDEEEETLSQPFVSVSSPGTSTPAPLISNSTKSLPAIRSLLPACFPSNTTCTESTNSCSGHGFCYAQSSKCFSCRCGSTVVRQDSDGTNKKTVYWGGSACERKDVSVPFFLFAGFGVFMTAIIVGAVGMMYSMGSEELPSVIGAGVAGPRVQR